MSVPAAASSLLLVTVITSFCADYRESWTKNPAFCRQLLTPMYFFVQLLHLSRKQLNATASPSRSLV